MSEQKNDALLSASHSLKRSLSVEDKENDTCSLQDVIDSEKERNEIASAVLGASDAINCSYDEGYVYRQALYCCITCSKAKVQQQNLPTTDESAYFHGICLACSYECHQNHELYELYTKRFFRCDCGNEKFKGSKLTCKLRPNKDSLNTQNKYNHNFNGLYCTCNKPYPETSDSLDSSKNNQETEEDEMIQCTVCEDWFHFSHLIGKEKFPANEDYDEMICQGCMLQNDFLWYYQGQIALKNAEVENSQNNDTEALDVTSTPIEEANRQADPNICFLEKLKAKNKYVDSLNKNQACCFMNNWRNALCKCDECMKLYKEKNVEFLIKPNDTINYYEECGKLKEAGNKIDENKLLNDELSKLNRTSQVELLQNLNDFKQELKDFLANFALNGKVVKAENISEFFEKLNERKKRKLELDGDNANSGYYCK